MHDLFELLYLPYLGTVPVRLKEYENPDQPTDVSRIDFSITRKINRKQLLKKLHEQERKDGIWGGEQVLRIRYGQLMEAKVPSIL